MRGRANTIPKARRCGPPRIRTPTTAVAVALMRLSSLLDRRGLNVVSVVRSANTTHTQQVHWLQLARVLLVGRDRQAKRRRERDNAAGQGGVLGERRAAQGVEHGEEAQHTDGDGLVAVVPLLQAVDPGPLLDPDPAQAHRDGAEQEHGEHPSAGPLNAAPYVGVGREEGGV